MLRILLGSRHVSVAIQDAIISLSVLEQTRKLINVGKSNRIDSKHEQSEYTLEELL
jgi:hypothetical protein